MSRGHFGNIIVFFFLIALLSGAIGYLHIAPHVALLMATLVLLGYGTIQGISWSELETAMADGVYSALKPLFILSLIGILVAVWMLSGTIPTILYYGLDWLSPGWFYISSMMLCMAASSFNGSSVATVSTIGVALMGVAVALGLPPGASAGAIICGACFGDKCSPLSETTNLAPSMVGVDLYEHVRHLLWTTVPALIITFIIFAYLSWSTPIPDLERVGKISMALKQLFVISPWALLSPLVVMILAFCKVPALASFLCGILTGLATTVIVQGNCDFVSWAQIIQHGYEVAENDDPLIAQLLNRGGLQSMMWAVSLVGIALVFGGLLRRLGILESMIVILTRKLRSRSSLTIATVSSCIGINLLSGEQYLSIVLPGQTFAPLYAKAKVAAKHLSRSLEDGGTLVNPLIPWGVSGAFYTSALHVEVVDYLPYVFFLFLSPIISIAMSFTTIDD